MKRIFSMVCCIMFSLCSLFSPVHAENTYLSFRAIIPESFIYETTTIYGDHVSFSVPVVVPEVSKFPILRVKWNMNGDSNSYNGTTWDEDDTVETNAGFFAYSFPLAEDQAPASDILPDDAVRNVMSIFSEKCPDTDMEYYSRYTESGIYLIPEHSPTGFDYAKDYMATHEPVPNYEKGLYYIRARQVLQGIPVFFQDYFCISNMNDPADPCPRITAKYMDQGHYSYSIETVSIDDTVAEEASLLPYTEIEKQIKEYIDLGLIQQMEKLELGYMLYYENEVFASSPRSQDVMLAIPTWTVSGYFSMNAYEGIGPNVLPERTEWAATAERNVKIYSGMDCVRIDALTGRFLYSYEDPAPRTYDLQEALKYE